MKTRKIFNIALLVMLTVSFLFGGNIPASAQGPQPPKGNGQGQQKKITQAEREEAALRAAEAGFTPEAIGEAAMAMPSDAPRYFSHPNYANSPLPGNIVVEWNAIAQEIVQPAPMPGMPMMSSVSMSEAFVYLSYVQAAVYNALVAIEGGYEPYNSTLTADPDASRDAAVAAAAYGVLKNYFPMDATLDGKYAASLDAIPDGSVKTAGIAVGQAAAAEIIALRANDGRGDASVLWPLPGSQDGGFVPVSQTMPIIDPWMAVMTPFMLAVPDQFRPAPPPALGSAEFEAQVDITKSMGGMMSMSRTPDQTEAARFWGTNGVIQFNSAYRNVALSRGLNLLDSARLLAMGNMVGTDALIACFDSKYYYNLMRPVTAIQAADPAWMPLMMTPNHPEYVAGHNCFGAAQAAVFTEALGTDQIELDLASSVTGTTRHYPTAASMRQEIIGARVWGGMHYPMSAELGDVLGNTVATFALANYFNPAVDLSAHATFSGGLRKFVDGLPGLGAGAANNLGQYIPVAVPDTTTYPGSDYYVIELVEYTEQMHSDLPPTKLRGYRQGNMGGTPANYLGPTIIAQKDRPVRILFRNLLPTGAGGNLFIPTDTTVMGSGMTPDGHANPTMVMDPLNPMCSGPDKADMVAAGLCYAENRATLHLHGGISPWISDGTPHQWTTPANENTPYPKGVSVRNVPDMSDPGPGALTFFYTNQQSARLMFYHDHAWGITRLNVYAGEAAPYIITDATEQMLVNGGYLPGAADTIPLIIQDKTFVPSLNQLAAQDETWDVERWGTTGSLWLPHVYSPAQNPGDSSGVNQYGRWAYGPWFWPPTAGIEHGPVANPYYDPACDPDLQWCEPSLMPGTPYLSMGMESFNDTPVVNGTAYPTLTVDPKPYRFRVLNAANDRFFNLSIYKAVDANGVPCDISINSNPSPESTGVTCTEVLLNPAEVAAALDDPAGIFPTPLDSTKGPDWIQFGTEGGFLPAPVVIPAQYTTWVTDPTVFNAGNVDKHSLLLAPAERADVVVDFSQFAGQTLILYNDAPAAFPARDPRYDYYTGNPDLWDTGGAPSTLPGYGPNTRTVMQIKVNGGPSQSFNVTALQNAFKATSLGGLGVFQNSQHPIVVGQGAYNSAYGTSFQSNGPNAGLVQIFNTTFSFKTLAGGASGPSLTFPLQPKMIQDEMGEAFEPEYGRMSGFLGVETPNAQAGLQNMILHPYTFPPTEIINGVELPPGVSVQPISTNDDGTQIWKITHNGVDTHPIHFHLYDVQLINRVGWDGIIRKPDLNELGWKDTVRVSPLEDTIVALRPVIPQIPESWGGLPNSIRLLDPSMHEGEYIANTTQQEALGLPIFAFNPDGEPIDIINHYVNFGWEYVYHCHILSHEEMDMMHAQAVAIAPFAPSNLTAVRVGSGNNRRVDLAWNDNSKNETAFVIQKATAATGPWATLATVQSDRLTMGPGTGARTFSDPIGNVSTTYFYRVFAVNTVGDTWDYSNPAFNNIPLGGGFPTLTLESGFSNVGSWVATTPPSAPTLLTATTVRQGNNNRVTLTWTNVANETGYTIQRATNAAFTTGLATTTVGANVTTTVLTVPRGTPGVTTYYFRIIATNAAGASAPSNVLSIVTQ